MKTNIFQSEMRVYQTRKPSNRTNQFQNESTIECNIANSITNVANTIRNRIETQTAKNLFNVFKILYLPFNRLKSFTS